MTSPIERTRSISPDLAQQLLGSAAKLDAETPDKLSVERLHAIAPDVGISPTSVNAAISEYTAPVRDAAKPPIPRWLRVGLVAIPDRASALRFCWIFVGGFAAAPLLPLLDLT